MTMRMWRRVTWMSLRVQALVIRTVRIQRMGVNVAPAGGDGTAARRLDHWWTVPAPDEPSDLLARCGVHRRARETPRPPCGKEGIGRELIVRELASRAQFHG